MKKNMKGIELPVNVLVIIAIAVLVMLGIIALYVSGMSTWNPVAQYMTENEACGELKSAAPPCGISTDNIGMNWDADKNGLINNLDTLTAYCENYKACDEYRIDDQLPSGIDSLDTKGSPQAIEACCKAIVCGCSGFPAPKKIASPKVTPPITP